MAYDLGQLRIHRVIVHEVPRRRVHAEPTPLNVSEIDSPLTPDLRNFFREKVARSLAACAFDVVPEAGTASPVPNLTAEYLAGTRDLVPVSQEVALHLYNSQTGVNSDGLLVVADAEVAGLRALSILKLEKEDGVRVRQANVGGKSTFDIEHITELMLTNKTRVFKVGMFTDDPANVPPIEGSVCDEQRGARTASGVADFFLKQFLGCRLKEKPSLTTKKFFEAAQEFINELVPDARSKAKYQIALAAEIGANSGVVEPVSFAKQHLAPQHRQPYIERLGEREVPTTQFVKDDALVERQIARIQMTFQSGLALIGTPETVGERVNMHVLDDGRTRVEFEDTLEEIHGRS